MRRARIVNSYNDDRMKQDESVYLLKQLIQLTQKGLLRWKCTNYDPIQLLSDYEDGEEHPYLAHNVCIQAQYGGRAYFAELFESIQLCSGVGRVMLELDYDDGHGRFDPCKDAEPHVLCLFSNEDMTAFGDAVLPQIAGSEMITGRFTCIRYHTELQSDETLAQPLAALGQKLHEEKRLCDYHRAVTDEVYRRKLVSADRRK